MSNGVTFTFSMRVKVNVSNSPFVLVGVNMYPPASDSPENVGAKQDQHDSHAKFQKMRHPVWEARLQCNQN
jgi:hypothetical protein